MSITPTIRQLQIFQMLGHLGSFSKAADALNMSQPAFSQALRSLEDLLRVRLFERTKRSVTITPAGRILLSRTDRILADLEAAIREAQFADDPTAGRLDIAALSTIATRVLPTLLRKYRETHPGTSIRIFDDDPDGIIGKVKAHRVDLAFSCLFEEDDGVEFVPICEDIVQFVCARSNPLAAEKNITWIKLNDYDVVGVAKGSSIRALIDRSLPREKRLRNVSYEVAKVSSILEIIEHSDSVAVLPGLTLAFPEARRKFHFRPMKDPVIKRELGLILPRGSSLSAAAGAFRDIVADRSSYPPNMHSLTFRIEPARERARTPSAK